MSRHLTLLSCFALTAAVMFAGCDQQAAQQREAQASLDQAMRLLERSTVRFIPPDQPQDQPWAQYRLKLLEQARAQLDETIAQGDPVRQTVARALKGQIQQSEARLVINGTLSDIRALSARTDALVDQVVTLNIGDVAMTRLQRSESQAVQTLQGRIEDLQQQADDLAQQQQDLAQQIGERRQRIRDLREQAQASVTRADELRQQAFVATGSRQIDLEDQTAAAQSQSASLQSQADLLEVQIEDMQARQTLAQRREQLIRSNLDKLQAAVRQARQRDADRVQSRARTSEEIDKIANSLLTNLDELLSRFDSDVDQPLDEATSKLDAAAQLFGDAQRAADDRQMRQMMQSSELSARMDQAQAMTSHAIALSEMGNFVRFVQNAALPLTDAQKDRLQSAYQRLSQRQQDVLAALTQGEQSVVAQATQLAREIGGDDEQARAAMVEDYRRMADAAALQ